MENDIPEYFSAEIKRPVVEIIKCKLLFAHFLYLKEEFFTALDVYKETLRAVEKLVKEGRSIFFIKCKIANVLYKQGKYKQAQELYNEVYNGQIRLYGLDDEGALCTRSKIAQVLHRQCNNIASLHLLKLVLKKQEELLGHRHPDTLQTKLHTASVLMSLDKYEKAIVIYREVLEVMKNEPRASQLGMLSVRNNLALALSASSYKDAIELLWDIHSERKEMLGLEHSDTLRPLQNIAYVYHKEKQFDEAEASYKYILKYQKKFIGASHIDTLRTQLNYGNLLFLLGKHQEHIDIHRDTVDKLNQAVGSDHPDVLRMELMIEVSNLILKSNEPHKVIINYILGLWFDGSVQTKLLKDLILLVKSSDAIQHLVDFIKNNQCMI